MQSIVLIWNFTRSADSQNLLLSPFSKETAFYVVARQQNQTFKQRLVLHSRFWLCSVVCLAVQNQIEILTQAKEIFFLAMMSATHINTMLLN